MKNLLRIHRPRRANASAAAPVNCSKRGFSIYLSESHQTLAFMNNNNKQSNYNPFNQLNKTSIMSKQSIKNSLAELTKYRYSSDILSLIDDLDLIPVRNERIRPSHKHPNKRNSYPTY